MDKGIDRIVDIVEDHARMKVFIDGLYLYIKDGRMKMPDVPPMNDLDTMDKLAEIASMVFYGVEKVNRENKG